MANYYGYTRTNHFSVTNPDKLREIVRRIRWDEGELSFMSEEGGRFCFGAYTTICGLRKCPDDAESESGDDDDDEYDADGVYDALREIVAPDDAIIITEVGYEKLRYLTGYAVIITRNSIDCVDLRDAAITKARAMLQNPAYTTKNEY